MESAARPARVLLRSSILLTVYPGNLLRHTKDGRVYARGVAVKVGEAKMHSVDRRDSVPLTRRDAR